MKDHGFKRSVGEARPAGDMLQFNPATGKIWSSTKPAAAKGAHPSSNPASGLVSNWWMTTSPSAK